MGLTVHMGGTYAMMPGPRFETPAEIRALRSMGASVVGMTNIPEVVLCRELNMEYSTACVVTNHAAGMQKVISHEEVLEIFGLTINAIRGALTHAISTLGSKEGNTRSEDI
jgi:5'-methylthioadenosine phosphorylase